MIQRQFLDFGGITHSAGGRGRGGVCWFLPRFFFKKKFPHLCFFDLRGFNYLGLVWFRVCMDGFAVADTAAGRKVDGRQSSSLTPPPPSPSPSSLEIFETRMCSRCTYPLILFPPSLTPIFPHSLVHSVHSRFASGRRKPKMEERV